MRRFSDNMGDTVEAFSFGITRDSSISEYLKIRDFLVCCVFFFMIHSPGISGQAPVLMHYENKTGIQGIPLSFQPPQVNAGDTPISWSLINFPEGMIIDPVTGEASWNQPIEGTYYITISATNSTGSDSLEWVLMIVVNDFENPMIVSSKYMDFVVPPNIAQWMNDYGVDSYLNTCWEFMHNIVGHCPLNGRQVVRYDPNGGGGAHSGNPVEAGPVWWSTNPIDGWNLGAWDHEVGHNFHALTNMSRITDTWASGFFHHGMELMQTLLGEKLKSMPGVFASQTAYKNFVARMDWRRQNHWEKSQTYITWLQNGGRAFDYTGPNPYQVWGFMCKDLCELYGTDVLEKSIRAVRVDGLPSDIYVSADTDLKRNTVLFCIMSNSAGTDLRSYFDQWGFDTDGTFYEQINPIVSDTISHLNYNEDVHGWKRYSGNGHFYKMTTWQMPWHEGERYGLRNQGHLATIRSQEEEAWLSNRFSVRTNIWIGLTDEREEGNWQWSSGEMSEFRNWNSGEPNGKTNENYCAFRWGSNRGWNDASIDRWLWALIERDTFPVPNPGDFDHNGIVNVADLILLSSEWLSPIVADSNDQYDLDEDGQINIKDLGCFGRYWGRQY